MTKQLQRKAVAKLFEGDPGSDQTRQPALDRLRNLHIEMSDTAAPEAVDNVLLLLARHAKLERKIDKICEKRDEVDSRYDQHYLREGRVCIYLFDPGLGQEKQQVFACSHEEIDKHRQEAFEAQSGIFSGIPKWREKFEAKTRELHERFDMDVKIQTAQRTHAGLQQLDEEWRSTLDTYHALREQIASEVPTTVRGHFAKLAFFVSERAEGFDDTKCELWADIREGMNGLPGVKKWKRYQPKG